MPGNLHLCRHPSNPRARSNHPRAHNCRRDMASGTRIHACSDYRSDWAHRNILRSACSHFELHTGRKACGSSSRSRSRAAPRDSRQRTCRFRTAGTGSIAGARRCRPRHHRFGRRRTWCRRSRSGTRRTDRTARFLYTPGRRPRREDRARRVRNHPRMARAGDTSRMAHPGRDASSFLESRRLPRTFRRQAGRRCNNGNRPRRSSTIRSRGTPRARCRRCRSGMRRTPEDSSRCRRSGIDRLLRDRCTRRFGTCPDPGRSPGRTSRS